MTSPLNLWQSGKLDQSTERLRDDPNTAARPVVSKKKGLSSLRRFHHMLIPHTLQVVI